MCFRFVDHPFQSFPILHLSIRTLCCCSFSIRFGLLLFSHHLHSFFRSSGWLYFTLINSLFRLFSTTCFYAPFWSWPLTSFLTILPVRVHSFSLKKKHSSDYWIVTTIYILTSEDTLLYTASITRYTWEDRVHHNRHSTTFLSNPVQNVDRRAVIRNQWADIDSNGFPKFINEACQPPISKTALLSN